MARRLLAAMSSNRDHHNSPDEIQKYAGIAPVTERSGKKNGYTGGIHVPNFYGKHSLNGLGYQYVIRFGPMLITSNKKAKGNHTIPLSGR